MKVFLSHSTADKEFVEKLAKAMSTAGFEPWLCEQDIEAGANFVAKISQGLKDSDLLLLVWSPDAADSAWTEQEWTSILKHEVEESRIRLGLIMLRQCALPPLLDTKNYIDATRDRDAGIRNTMEWLKRREGAQRLSGLKAPVYLPDYRLRTFVGRNTQLDLLCKKFTAEPTTFLLYGEPGSGKTTLALHFAWEAQKDFDAVIFQTCGQRSLDAITAELVERLPLEVKALPPDQQRAAAKGWLRQRQSLLVLDDVWLNEQDLFDVKELEPGPACSVLYTSRLQSLPGVATDEFSEVKKFTETECDHLFHVTLDQKFSADEVTSHRDALIGFAQKVDMLPIAVAVGTRLLLGKSALALDRGVLKLRLNQLTDGLHNVNTLFAKAIESQGRDGDERKLLNACANCVQEGFWLPLAAQIADLSQDKAEDAANNLVYGSLLRVLARDRQRFQVHALLRDQVRTMLAQDSLVVLQERHATAVESLFKDWESRWRDCRECLEEIIPATEHLWTGGAAKRSERLTTSGYELGLRVGQLGVALEILMREEAFWNRAEDVRAAKEALQRCYGRQAVILRDWGRLDEAMALLKKQEAFCLELNSKEGLQRSYGNQALILKDWGRLEEAMGLFNKVETICLELDDKIDLQITYGSQATILYAWGRLEKAMALHKKAEAICLELDVKDGLQASYGDQALILQDWGRLEEAMALYKKQEALCLELGNNDGLQISYGNQANILRVMGRLSEALKLYREKERICLALRKKSSLGHCYWNWGVLARAQGDQQTENQKLKHALAIFSELNMSRERDEVLAELDKNPCP